MAFMLGVIRSISALSFAIEASSSPSTSLGEFCVDVEGPMSKKRTEVCHRDRHCQMRLELPYKERWKSSI